MSTTRNIGARIAPELEARLDALAATMAAAAGPGVLLSRSDAMRAALEAGLRVLEAQHRRRARRASR